MDPSDHPLDDSAAYRALQTHDARFDGRLFVGVTSTGIYCRPVCRVRLPRRENCRFYAHAAQAEQAGFRPCLRCRPELAPGLSLIDGPHTLALQAMHLIDAAAARGDPCGLPHIAALLGVSDRHLRRIFQDAHGVKPIDYLATRRLLQAKGLLTDTALPITQVALASGFASLRRFNAAFVERYRMNPSQLRAQREAPKGALKRTTSEPGAITVRLAWRPPLDAAGLLAFIGERALAGIETVSPDGVLRRTLTLDAEPQRPQVPAATGWVEARFEATASTLTLRIAPALAQRLPEVLQRVRHAFDLDAEPASIDAQLTGLPHPAPAGLRVPGSFDGFETAVRVVLGQQVSVAAARTLAQRLVERFGEPVETPWPGLNRLFPRPQALAEADPEVLGKLGIVRQRVKALQALAGAVHSGELALHRGAPLATTLATLAALPGIGPWTVQMLALRVYGWPDAFPASDIGVLRALGVATAVEAEQAAQAWRPWRAYAVMALWRQHALLAARPPVRSDTPATPKVP